MRVGSVGTVPNIPGPRDVQCEGPAPRSRQVVGSIRKGQVRVARLEEGVVGQGARVSHRKEDGRWALG